MARNAALPILTAEPGLTHYLEEIRRFPMLERQEEYLLAKRWREHGDRDAAHKLVTSHLRLVTKIARDYRGHGLPISEAISEGNVGLMQAVERFEPEKGFRFATYAVWWIKAAIQEYILRSWSLVKMGTTANQKGKHRYTDVKPERIERAIADDLAFLAAHPVRRSNSETMARRRELLPFDRRSIPRRSEKLLYKCCAVLSDHWHSVVFIDSRMGTTFRYLHPLGPRNGPLEFQSYPPITRRCLGHLPNLMALFAEMPILGACGSGLGPIIEDNLSRWHRPPLASVRLAGNAEGKFDDVAHACTAFPARALIKASIAAVVRKRRRVVSIGVFVGGVLCTRSAWAMGGPPDGSG
jgi:RNA polymerase sigma factor (sigma-70 family)